MKKQASMGPQLDSCGRRGRRANRDWADELQWGRNLTVAEGSSPAARRARSHRCFNGAAT